MSSPPSFRRLLVVSHVCHYRQAGKIYAYGPYVRELDMWAELFTEMTIASPMPNAPPPGDCLPFTHTNIQLAAQPVMQWNHRGITAKLHCLVAVFQAWWKLTRLMRQADVVHVRCPGNLGFIGAVLAPLFAPCRIAKFAGAWNGYEDETATWRWQRRILGSWWWRAPVTVYGQWPDQPDHVVSFFTSILTETEMSRAKQAVAQRRQRHTNPTAFRILFVGRISGAKHVPDLVRAMAAVPAIPPTELVIVGDGPCREKVENAITVTGLQKRVLLRGALPFAQVLEEYAMADILVLASDTEGWPKAIAEGMAFGLICIGSTCSIVPKMLENGRGLVVPPGDVNALTNALRTVLSWTPEERLLAMEKSAAWGQRFTLENLRDAIRDLLLTGKRPAL